MINPYIELACLYKDSIDEDAYRQSRNHKQLENLRSNSKINIDAVLAGKENDNRLFHVQLKMLNLLYPPFNTS